MTNTSALSAADLTAATPVDRDRYADLLRLFSIGMVALGHWVVALITTHGSGDTITSMPLMLTTWVWQVMALFFFVGGFAHARALRHRPPMGEFIRARMTRLLPPAMVMLAVWSVLATMLTAVGMTSGDLVTGLHKITVPLWFLGVYLVIVLAAPSMMRLHLRFGLWRVVGALAAATALVDVVAAAFAAIGYLNLLFVWLAVHQLGYGYADGTLARGGRRLAAALAAGGLGVTVLLVFGPRSFGMSWYPVPMVGLPGNEVSNATPPTCALFAQSLFLVGTALLLRRGGTALVGRPKVWLAVASGNTVIMTIFCWHLSACYLVEGALLVTGVELPAALWLAVPAYSIACAAVCAVLVVGFRRFERPAPAARLDAGRGVVGVLAAATGLYLISATGFDGLPNWPAASALTLVALGMFLLHPPRVGDSARVGRGFHQH